MKLHWPEAPLGIYSASVGAKEIDSITVAGIQSIYNKAEKIGYRDLVIVDEAHTINGVALDEDWTNDNEKVFTLARARKERREREGDI